MTEAVMGKPTEHAHGAPAGDRWLGRHEAYMGGCDAPSLGKADPSVAHAADPLRITLQVLDIGGREVPTKCCNDEMTFAPAKASRLARRAEGNNGVMPIQVFGGPEAQRVRRVPEKFIHRRSVVGEQRLLVATDRRRDFGDNARVVDLLHDVFAFISGDDEAIVQCCIVAGQRKTDRSSSVTRSRNESADTIERRNHGAAPAIRPTGTVSQSARQLMAGMSEAIK
jgi:hypothetical protein